MTTLLAILIVLTFWHFVWDGILAPSYRADYRFRLFALRDQARELKIQSTITGLEFRYLEDSLNTAVIVLSSLTITGLISFRRAVQNDPKLKHYVEERMAFLNSSHDEVRRIAGEASDVVYFACNVNGGAWLIPLVAVFVPIQALHLAVSRIIALTESEALRFVPAPTYQPLISN